MQDIAKDVQSQSLVLELLTKLMDSFDSITKYVLLAETAQPISKMAPIFLSTKANLSAQLATKKKFLDLAINAGNFLLRKGSRKPKINHFIQK
jgi:hypothetical protein